MHRFNRHVIAGSFCAAAIFAVGGASSSPAVQEVAIECKVSSNNDGCEKTVSCPAGTKIQSAIAACNLEHGSVTDDQVSSVAGGYMKVVRPSDHIERGNCWVGSNQLSTGEAAIVGVNQLSSISVGCQEHDKNGGDCHIRGSLLCH